MRYLSPLKKLKNNLFFLYLIIGVNFTFGQQQSNRMIISEGYLIQKKTHSVRVKFSNKESEKFEHYEYFFIQDSTLASCFVLDILTSDISNDSSIMKLVFKEQVSNEIDLKSLIRKSVVVVSNDFLDYSGIKGALDKGVFDGSGNLHCSYNKLKELQNIFECKTNLILDRIKRFQLITKSTDVDNLITEVSSIRGTFIFVYGKKLIPDGQIGNCFVFISTLF